MNPLSTRVTAAIHRLKLWPMISLPDFRREINLALDHLLVSFIGGLFSGFLGGGAGYIRMPMMVYVLGIPTHLAVGTDLFEIIISASYGTFSHAIKGNVDILIALVMQHRRGHRRADRRHPRPNILRARKSASFSFRCR